MGSSEYRKGRKKEYKIMNKARGRGLLAFRSAGSRSKVDVCVIDVIKKEIVLYQCKPKNITQREIEKLNNEMIATNGTYKMCFKVV